VAKISSFYFFSFGAPDSGVFNSCQKLHGIFWLIFKFQTLVAY
jgi:hypothetical protein